MRQLVAGKHLAKFVSFVPKFPHFSHEDGSGGDVDDDNEGKRRAWAYTLSLSVASGDRMHSEKGPQQACVYVFMEPPCLAREIMAVEFRKSYEYEVFTHNPT